MYQKTLTHPEPLTVEKISYFINKKGINPLIAEIDFEMVKMKMRDPEEGENWTYEQCESAEIEYKRFLHLCMVIGKGIVPNKIMDKFWHYHILDTQAYHKDCDKIFGHYLHHFPYFGMRGEEDRKNLESAFDKTKKLYLQAFEEDMARDSKEMKCWHNCQSRCWNACSSK